VAVVVTQRVAVAAVLAASDPEPLLLRQQLMRSLLVLAAPQALPRPQRVQVLHHLYLALSLRVAAGVLQVILILLERAALAEVAQEISN